MSNQTFETKREYLLATRITGQHHILTPDLKDAPEGKGANFLEIIDQITHEFPSEYYFTATLHSIFGTEANPWQPDFVKVFNKRHPHKLLPVIYANMPLPLSANEMSTLLESGGIYLEIAKGDHTLSTYDKWIRYPDVEYNLEFATQRFINEITKSYRMRRELTLEFFKRDLISYQSPSSEPLLEELFDEEKNGQMKIRI